MGFLDKWKNQNTKSARTAEFDAMILAADKGEKWAEERFHNMWEQYGNDPNWMPKVNSARIRIYQEPARQGDKRAQYWLGLALRQTDREQSLNWLVPLAREGNVDAMTAIALGYTEFGGYGDDEKQYLYWYTKAAEAGDADAQATVGLQYLCENNYRVARKWYQMAAEQDYTPGLIGLAECYVRKRDEEVFQAYQVGQMTEEQNQTLKKREEKYEVRIENLYIKAINKARCQEHFADAAHHLGHFYENSLIKIKNEEARRLNTAKRAAYFYFVAYQESENEFDLQSFRKVTSEQNLLVDTGDIEGWAKKEGLF